MIPGNANSLLLAAATASATTVGPIKSVRFNSADSAYLNRTPSSAGSNTTWTLSTWVKKTGNDNHIFGAGAGDTPGRFGFGFDGSDKIFALVVASGSTVFQVTTDAVFRDPAAWYHIVLIADTGNSTQANRLKIYVNGNLQSVSGTLMPLSQNTFVNTTAAHTFGRRSYTASDHFNGYLASTILVDGTAKDVTDFGAFDSNGVWQAATYSGTFGTNGFHLFDFANESGIGNDSSGNDNDFTVNNISSTAGDGNDVLFDAPTNGTQSDTGAGGEVSGCYCTFNPLYELTGGYDIAFSNGNLEATNGGDAPGTMAFGSGKKYFELTVKSASSFSQGYFGIVNIADHITPRSWATSQIAAVRDSGSLYGDGSTGSAPAAAQVGTVYGFAVDVDNQKVFISVNGTYLNSANPASGTGASFTGRDFSNYAPLASMSAGNSQTIVLNTGQRAFNTAAPSGFQAHCTTNLPTPTVADGSTAFDAKTFTANNGSQSISLGFSPDLVWTKSRANAYESQIFDRVRGDSQELVPSSTAADRNLANSLTFDSSGFTLPSNNNNANVGTSGSVAWAFDAGANSSKTFTVKVVSDSGNKYRFDDFGTSAVTLDLEEGSTYVFDQSDSSNSGHPLRFSTTADGTHGSGSEYTTGVTTYGTPGNAGAKTTIVVAASAPTLYYYCSVHSGMGGQANTNSTAGASNFDGTIQSTVRASASSGFSIVKFTGTGSSASVGHQLNTAPSMVIAKNTDAVGDWPVWHSNTTGATYTLYLNSNAAQAAASTIWPSAPTSSVVNVGTGAVLNASSQSTILYCFSPVKSYSAFGSFVGNGSTDGVFVFTDFRPSLIVVKRVSGTGNWHAFDTTRDVDNKAENAIYWNLSSAETVVSFADINSNGFKLRTTDAELNGSGDTYIYFAFAENPFQANGGLAR